MVVHFLEDQPLRDLVAKTEKHSTEYDVLAQTSILSLQLFGEDCIEDYSKPGAAGRLWVMYDFGSPDNKKNSEKDEKISKKSMQFREFLGSPRNMPRDMAAESTIDTDFGDLNLDDNNIVVNNSNIAVSSEKDEEKIIEKVESEAHWVQPEPGCGGRPRLLGFLLAKLLPHTGTKGGQCFTIVFAGVPTHLRGKGTGKKLVASVLKHGRERKNIALVTLSALPDAIKFWERCGLKSYPDAMKVKEGSAAGQIYMEVSVRGKGNKKKR